MYLLQYYTMIIIQLIRCHWTFEMVVFNCKLPYYTNIIIYNSIFHYIKRKTAGKHLKIAMNNNARAIKIVVHSRKKRIFYHTPR